MKAQNCCHGMSYWFHRKIQHTLPHPTPLSARPSGHGMDERIRKYQAWLASRGREPALVLGNEVLQQPDKFRAEEVLMALARGSRCFDFDYYVAHNHDVVAARGRCVPVCASVCLWW